ncbi:tyrosine-type recombinase/integrase [Lysinibacillus sp. NPDC093688]|uniref:tyrosine-type recombinase/integrase n=1 Tax=Lysinibacillus sp. NPDC093688 TaxID=3390577 RepID=UPI003D08CD5F
MILPLHPNLIPLQALYKASLKSYQIYPSVPTRFTLHHLRHTVATLMLQQNKENVDLRTLQELLDHESIGWIRFIVDS